MNKVKKLRYIDLFAGCGGLSLGLFNSNQWHGLFAVEKSPDAFATLKHNLVKEAGHFGWPEWLPSKNHDIDFLLKKYQNNLEGLRGTVDLVAGGPPCQGFSTAGRRIETDKRNGLVYSYLKFIELVQPSIIFFENVKGFRIGFKNSEDKRGIPYSEIVIQKLKRMGYHDAEARVLNFSNFGVPQNRERCIIVATKNGNASSFFELLESGREKFLEEKNLSDKQNLKMAISDIQRKHGEVESSDSKNYMSGCYSNRSLTPYQRLMRSKAKKYPDSHRFVKHSPRVSNKFKIIIRDKLTSKEVQEIFHTKKTSTKLLEASKPTPTLTTLPDDYVHYSEPRILTVREYARIQSFPDWFHFRGKYTTGGPRRKQEVPRYSQIGNAIPPLFAELAGIQLEKLSHG